MFRYGVQHGDCESDPSRDLKGAVVPPPKHRTAVTDPAKLGELMRAIRAYQGTPVVRAALALAPLVPNFDGLLDRSRQIRKVV